MARQSLLDCPEKERGGIEAYSFVSLGGFALKRGSFLDEPVDRLTVDTISRRQALRLIGGLVISCGALASIPGAAAWAQVPSDPAAQPDSIQGPAIATKEQAQRWLSMNKALDVTYDWIELAWSWGEAVGIRPDLMLAQQ